MGRPSFSWQLTKWKHHSWNTKDPNIRPWDIKHRAQKMPTLTDHRTSLRVPFFSLGTGKNMLTMANEMAVGRNSWLYGFLFGLTIWVCICAQVWICICGIVWWIVNVRVNGTKSVLSLTDELWTGCGLGHHTTCYCFGWHFAQQNSILGGQTISNVFKILLDVNCGAKF